MEKWILRNKNIEIQNIDKLSISKGILKILINRGFKEFDKIKDYLFPNEDILKDEKKLKDFYKAIDILVEFQKNQGKVRIVGDYDVDGIISVYILYKTFSDININVDYVIPDRINDGYGINKNIVDRAKKDGIGLIITCDNGITAIEPIKYAKSLGIKVIVTDHHDVYFKEEEDGKLIDVIPEADAILNQKQKDCKYEFKKICGAGVCFKLCKGLYEKFNMQNQSMKLLEFVCIATICDVVDLEDENRFIVKYGMNLLNNTEHIGLNAIIDANNLFKGNLNSYEIGYIIGPCLNALGRLESATKGLDLLLCENQEVAYKLALEIKDLNDKRKAMTIDGVVECIRIIEENEYKNNKIIVIYSENIHESIAGIIAGRIKEKYHRAVIVLTRGEHGVKGSARSIEIINIFKAIYDCKDLLNSFGGHEMAAGLSLDFKNIDKLRERLNENCNLRQEDFVKYIYIDLFSSISDINYDFLKDLELLEPFGKNNVKLILGDKKLRIYGIKRIGKNKNYISLKVISRDGKIYDFVYFGDPEEFDEKFIEKYGQASLDKLYNTKPYINNNYFMDVLYEVKIENYNFTESIKYFLYKYRF